MQDNKPFQWTDEQVLNLLTELHGKFRLHAFKEELKRFKASNSPLKKEVDWEIQCLVVDNRNFWLQKNGLYRNEAFGSEHSAERIMKWADFKHIHSVCRLSDNSIWAVGDNLQDYGIIKKFNIQSNKWIVAHTDLNNDVLIEDFKKTPEKTPLFTTEDGKEIFEGEEYWTVCDKDGFAHLTWAAIPRKAWDMDKSPDKHNYTFSTEKAAKEYILLSKPCLSANDIIALDLDIHLRSNDPKFPFGHCDILVFPTESLKRLASSKIEGGK